MTWSDGRTDRQTNGWMEAWIVGWMVDVLIPVGIGKERRRPGMVRMGRGETMSPGVLTWAMDSVAERYAEQDGRTLQAAGDHPHHVYNIHCGFQLASAPIP